MAKVHVCGGRNQPPKSDPGNGIVVINTTSRAGWSSGLSPFIIGPCQLPSGDIALNMENAYQHSKIYRGQVDSNNEPTQAWWVWARKGWSDPAAHRYPMGKGKKPLYLYWDGEHLDYVTGRKKCYIPLYREAVLRQKAFIHLLAIYNEPNVKELYLWDFDGYDKDKHNMSYEDVINCATLKMGHAFVLAMLLEQVDVDKLLI